MEWYKTHFYRPRAIGAFGWTEAACGVESDTVAGSNTTTVPKDVTCKRCNRTRFYRRQAANHA